MVKLKKMSSAPQQPCPNPSNSGGVSNTTNCPQNRSASIFYFVTTICAMLVLATVTILFFFCLFVKRRRLQAQMRHGQGILPPLSPAPPGDMTAYEIAAFYGQPSVIPPNNHNSGPTPTTGAPNTTTTGVSKNVANSGPFHCVIMAGEDQPTYIAHPLTPTPQSSSSPKGDSSRNPNKVLTYGTTQDLTHENR